MAYNTCVQNHIVCNFLTQNLRICCQNRHLSHKNYGIQYTKWFMALNFTRKLTKFCSSSAMNSASVLYAIFLYIIASKRKAFFGQGSILNIDYTRINPKSEILHGPYFPVNFGYQPDWCSDIHQGIVKQPEPQQNQYFGIMHKLNKRPIYLHCDFSIGFCIYGM